MTEEKDTTQDGVQQEKGQEEASQEETKETQEEEVTDASSEEKDNASGNEDDSFEQVDIEPITRFDDDEEDTAHPSHSDSSSDEDIDPEDEKTIGKVVDKRLKTMPNKKEVLAIKDQIEVETFIRDNPEYKKYKNSMLKHLSTKAYSGVPPRRLAFMLAGDELMKIGAKKEREAQQSAKETQDTGTQVRSQSGGKTDWSKLSSEEFAAQKNKILGQS